MQRDTDNSPSELSQRPWAEVVQEWIELNGSPESKDGLRYKEVRQELVTLARAKLQRRQANRQPEQGHDSLDEVIAGPSSPEDWERAQEELHAEKFGRFHNDEDEWMFGR